MSGQWLPAHSLLFFLKGSVMKKFLFAVVLLIGRPVFAEDFTPTMVHGLRSTSPYNTFVYNEAPWHLGKANGVERHIMMKVDYSTIPRNAWIFDNQISFSRTDPINLPAPPTDGGILKADYAAGVTWNTAGGTPDDGLTAADMTGGGAFSMTAAGNKIVSVNPSNSNVLRDFVRHRRFATPPFSQFGIGLRCPSAIHTNLLSNPISSVTYDVFFLNLDYDTLNDNVVYAYVDFYGSPRNVDRTVIISGQPGTAISNLQYVYNASTQPATWTNANSGQVIVRATSNYVAIRFNCSTNNPIIRVGTEYAPTTNYDELDQIVGDVNGDRFFDSSDLIQIYQAGKFETGAVAKYSEGDWNDDGYFNSSDLIVAFQDGHYEGGNAALAADWEEINQ